MELNHKIYGEGFPLIILHGLFGMLDNWQTIAKELSKDYMVILLDLRNHGKSPHSEDWSVEIMANDVIQFMEDNWIHEMDIIGHSMGGKIAMQLATEYSSLQKGSSLASFQLTSLRISASKTFSLTVPSALLPFFPPTKLFRVK